MYTVLEIFQKARGSISVIREDTLEAVPHTCIERRRIPKYLEMKIAVRMRA